MFYVLSLSLSLFARFRFIFALRSAEGAREKRSRGSTNCFSLFFGKRFFSRFTKKKTHLEVFLFCLAREKEHASARFVCCTRDDDANDDNERAIRESERFVFSSALFVFISVRGCVFNSDLFGDCR
jgi:hypothetical protein